MVCSFCWSAPALRMPRVDEGVVDYKYLERAELSPDIVKSLDRNPALEKAAPFVEKEMDDQSSTTS